MGVGQHLQCNLAQAQGAAEALHGSAAHPHGELRGAGSCKCTATIKPPAYRWARLWSPHGLAAEAAEVLFDHGHSGVYASTREELGQRLSAAQQAQRAPPAAAPPPHEAAAAAAEFGRPPQAAAAVEGQGGGTVAGGLSSAGGGRRHHHVPPAASPAAAAEPPVSPDIPSMPSGERTAATTRGGAGVAAAAHGFAAELPRDVLEERPASLAPPKASGGARG